MSTSFYFLRYKHYHLLILRDVWNIFSIFMNDSLNTFIRIVRNWIELLTRAAKFWNTDQLVKKASKAF